MPQAPAFNLLDFRKTISAVALNQYYIVKIPQLGDQLAVTALSRTTDIPAFTKNVLEVPFRGIPMKIEGSPTYSEWTVNFLADQAHSLRHAVLLWMQSAYNVLTLSNFGHNEYKQDGISVSQLAYNKEISSTVIFYGMWPSSVGPITLDQTGGGVEMFDVTFSYDFWVMNSIAGDVNDSNVMIDVNVETGIMTGVTVAGTAGVKFNLNP